MEAFILFAFLGLVILALKGVGTGNRHAPTTARTRAGTSTAQSGQTVTEFLKTPEGQILDFLARLRQLDDQSIGLVLATANYEFQRLAKMSPDSELWFKELDPRYISDLKNLEAALQIRVSAFQAHGEMAQTPHLMVMLHTVRGILNPRLTMAAIEMWTELNKRGSQHLEYGIEAATELVGLDFSEFNRLTAEYFMPLALFEKAQEL